jgi:hypothetical protein
MLDGQARKWPTLDAGCQNSNKREPGRPRAILLNGVVKTWPSSAARDVKGANQNETHSEDQLANVACHCSLPAPATSALGGESSQSTRRLNPRFVEWLMGLPPNWTIAGRIGFGPAEMASYLSMQRRHLWYLLKG